MAKALNQNQIGAAKQPAILAPKKFQPRDQVECQCSPVTLLGALSICDSTYRIKIEQPLNSSHNERRFLFL